MKGEFRRFATGVCLALLLVYAVLAERHAPFLKSFLFVPPIPDWLGKPLAILAWLSLAWTVARGCELFVWRRVYGQPVEGMPRQRKLVTDLFNLGLYVFAVGIISVDVFGQPPAGLIATSGILAIVMGLALQQVLSDLFAGIALNIERPFKAGEWVSIDQIQGIVLMTNWRSTHLRTRTLDLVVLPNAVIGRARLTNHSRPQKLHIDTVDLHLHYGFDAELAQKALRDAALGVDGVLKHPAPIVLMLEMRPVTVVWRISFFIEDFAQVVLIRAAVLQAAYAALRTGTLSAWAPRNEAHVSLIQADRMTGIERAAG